MTDDTATFLLFDASGRLTGYQRYNPNGDKLKRNTEDSRYYLYGKGIFGMETFKWTNHLFVVEGIFDSTPLHQRGHSCISVLCNDPKYLRNWFSLLNRPIYTICDSGKAGQKLAKFGHKSYTVKDDVGAASEEEIDEFLDFFEVPKYL